METKTAAGTILLLCVAISLHSPTSSAISTIPRKPNILIFIADDLGIGDVGCFGNDTIRTPNLDRLADEGVKLTHHLAAASVCTPSRAALMTGRYPIRFGMVPTNIMRVNMFVASASGLPPEEITFAEMLKQQQYSTGIVGKWHLGLSCTQYGDNCHHPLNQGFDFFYGLPLTNLKDFGNDGDNVAETREPNLRAKLAATLFGVVLLSLILLYINVLSKRCAVGINISVLITAIVFLLICKNLKTLNSIIMRNTEIVEQPIRLNDNLSERLVNESVQFLQEHYADPNPFLLVVSWVQVHVALHASERFRGRSKHGRYGDEVEELDWSTGQVLEALTRLGIADNTFVYFTSDNGGHREEIGLDGIIQGGWNGIYPGGKTQGGMEGGIRVPTIARWPGVIPAGSSIDQPTTQMDILPTLAHITQGPMPCDREIDGRNILPMLKGDTESSPHDVLVHYCGSEIHAARLVSNISGDVWKALYATPRWKEGTEECVSGFVCDCYGTAVVRHNPPLLYNVAKDPAEELPLDTESAQYRKIVEQIETFISRHTRQLNSGYIVNQFSWRKLLPLPWLQPCCNFPYCRCTDSVYP